MHKLGLETRSSFNFLFEAYRGTWVVTSKSKKNRSVSNQVGNAFQTLFVTDFARDSQNGGKRLRAACFYTFQMHFVDIRDLWSLWKTRRFLNYWYKTLSNCGYSLKNSIVQPTKTATFWPTKDNLFCRRQPLVFTQVKTFVAPANLTVPPPKRLVWIRRCHRCSILAVTLHRYLHEVQWSWFAIAGEWC